MKQHKVLKTLARPRPTQAAVQEQLQRSNQAPAIAEANANALQAAPPVGSGMEYYCPELPDGDKYRWADGDLLDSLEYPELYAKMGTIWNTGGEAVGMFRLPDHRQRTGVGAGTKQGLVSRVLSTLFGADQTTLNTTQIPAHDHDVSTDAAGSHNHELGNAQDKWLTYSNTDWCRPSEVGTGNAVLGGWTWYQFPDTTSAGSHSHSINESSVGGGLGHDNHQPSITVHYIVRVRP